MATEGLQSARRGLDVVRVGHLQYLPSASREAYADILGEGQRRRPFDTDMVAVVNPAQPAQLQMPHKRRGLCAQAFHHVAVAGQREHAVLEQCKAGAIVGGAKPCLGDGHAHADGQALAKRPGGGFDPGGPAVFRVPCAAAPGLAEALQVGHRYRKAFFACAILACLANGLGFHTAQMQQPIPDGKLRLYVYDDAKMVSSHMLATGDPTRKLAEQWLLTNREGWHFGFRNREPQLVISGKQF